MPPVIQLINISGMLGKVHNESSGTEMNQRIIKLVLALFGIIIVTYVARSLILGGATVATLQPGPALSGTVAQSLSTSGNNASMPRAGKDFNLKIVRYFDSNSWVVVSAASPNKTNETNTVILQRIDGMYQAVLGPGTAFPNGYLQSLPSDVAQYLSAEGVIYESVSQ